jgi:hypothetical protein
MKKNIFQLAFITLCVMATCFFAACEADKCKTRGVVCQNDGVCYDGICNCPVGFDGDSCQFKENEKFVAKYGGILLSSNGGSSLGTNDTITIVPNTSNKSGIILTGKKNPQKTTFNALVKNNSVTVDRFLAPNNYVYYGSGSLNGELLSLTMACDSLDVNGSVIKTITYTFAGNKH